jgi:transcriptional regulator with XRE-family HTH domain
MNQSQLAAALRVSKSLVAGFETARHIPQADTAQKHRQGPRQRGQDPETVGDRA